MRKIVEETLKKVNISMKDFTKQLNELEKNGANKGVRSSSAYAGNENNLPIGSNNFENALFFKSIGVLSFCLGSES